MDRIIEDGEKLGPKDRAERVALFRVQVIGPLLARDFQDHGELADEIRAIATKWHRPPESALGRQYSAPTIERRPAVSCSPLTRTSSRKPVAVAVVLPTAT